jgi:hypothetical protein
MKQFIEKWGIHLISIPTILGFGIMVFGGLFLDFENTHILVYTLTFCLLSSIYAFFLCEDQNAKLLEQFSTLALNQHKRQKELVGACRLADEVIYDMDQIIQAQDDLLERAIKKLTKKKKK